MATLDDPRSRPPRRGRPRPRRTGLFRFTVDQFYRLDKLGFFEDRRVELIEGVLYEMTANPPHAIASELLMRLLLGLFGADYSIRIGLPLDVGRRSLPEPDAAIVPGSARDYLQGHPRQALLLFEISDTTLRKDRGLKAHLYARAGIADYWIVNLNDRRLEIHRDPGPDPARKGRFRYRDITIVPADGHASPLARPGARIAAADLLP